MTTSAVNFPFLAGAGEEQDAIVVSALHAEVGREPLYISEFLCGSQGLCSVHKCTAGCLEHGMVQW